MSTQIGSVASLWRYPVKSLLGEEKTEAMIAAQGVVGDRQYALVDRETGRVVSAKQPRKWAALFELRASIIDDPEGPQQARITFPDGRSLTSADPNLAAALSEALARRVDVATVPPDRPTLEEYWPDLEGLAYRETVTEEAMPEGTFFDAAPLHILTTATLDRLAQLYPSGRFDVQRFRPNIVIASTGRDGFIENAWVGRTLEIGGSVRVRVTSPCPRCVMTTLPQGGLPKDPGILRAAATHNGANVGVYATVETAGLVRVGDGVRLA